MSTSLRKPIRAVFVLVLLAACILAAYGLRWYTLRTGLFGPTCIEGICVRLSLEEPVRALESARFVVWVRSDQDIDDLGVSLVGDLWGVSIQRIEAVPEGAVLAYQDERIVTWFLDTRAGEPYTFSGFIEFAWPGSSSCDTGEPIPTSYSLQAEASNPRTPRVIDFFGLCLDSSGNQVECRRQTCTVLLEPAPPNLTMVPFTPFPTLSPIAPSATPGPTVTAQPEQAWPTPTLYNYPAYHY